MLIVIDCNVFISAGLNENGTCWKVLQKAFGQYDVLYSDTIIKEIERTAQRPKFKQSKETILRLAKLLTVFGQKAPDFTIDLCLPDPDDEEYLRVALFGSLSTESAIITGNKKDFPPEKCQGVQVLNPREFLEQI